jgi:7-cyano-7-deazaguanine synthase
MLAELAKHYRQVFPVYVRQGLVWEVAEIQALRRFLRAAKLKQVRPLTILELPARDIYGRHWSMTGQRTPGATSPDAAVYLPGRNLMLLSKAAVYCAWHRIPVIAVGSLRHNPFPDATPEFFRDFAATAGQALRFKFQIVAPFRKLTKLQVLRRGQELPLQLSFCCIAPQRGRHCGVCNKCAERREAFRMADLHDRTQYRR